jgi:hypothetical protein
MKTQTKFRAWIPEEKKMIYWTLNDLLVRVGCDIDDYGDDVPNALFDWMQSTGLKDIKDVEIFEDDFIKIVHKDFKENDIPVIGRVIFNQDVCSFMIKIGDIEEDLVDWVDYEIIGHVNDNLEELK